jgi:phospholipid/cholesterol/gamma-HCH transport system substrate-binding protein
MAHVKRRSYDIWLGSFVALGLLVLLVLVFLIGKERRLFDRTISIYAHFPNVVGLAVGADVLLSGKVVGRVKAINFPLMSEGKKPLRDMTVAMEISHQDASWIRADSVARIDSKGLLGDKLINISIGSPEFNEISAGGVVSSTPPLDLNKAFEKAQTVLDDISETVAEAKHTLKGFTAEEGGESLSASVKSVSRILKEIESGQGVVHELIYDQKTGQAAKASIAHATQALESFNKAGTSLATLLNEIKDGSGIAHDLIYADDNGQFLRSLNKAALDMEVIAANLKSGKGSLGLLLTDPSIYNELYGLIGNLRRNRLLKAVIRHGVSQTEKKIDAQ